jgi:hypothetical protein
VEEVAECDKPIHNARATNACVTDTIQLCEAKIVRKKIRDSTTNQINATCTAIDWNGRRLQAANEVDRNGREFTATAIHAVLLLLRCIKKCVALSTLAWNDNIAGHSLCSVDDNRLLEKNEDYSCILLQYIDANFIKHELSSFFSLSFFAPKCVVGNNMKKLPPKQTMMHNLQQLQRKDTIAQTNR